MGVQSYSHLQCPTTRVVQEWVGAQYHGQEARTLTLALSLWDVADMYTTREEHRLSGG